LCLIGIEFAAGPFNSDFSLQEDDHVLDVLLLLREYLSLVNELHLGVPQYSPYKIRPVEFGEAFEHLIFLDELEEGMVFRGDAVFMCFLEDVAALLEEGLLVGESVGLAQDAAVGN
jgi:hypothetical protein